MNFAKMWKPRGVPHASLKRRDALLELTVDLMERAQFEVEETYRFQVDEQVIAIADLPPEFEGFRIAQLSDIHHSPYMPLDRLVEAVDETNALDADVVALTGDYITHTTKYIEPCAELLGRLRARHGVYAVLGNHDIWVGERAVREAFAKNGIVTLNNINTRIAVGNAAIWLCGLGDTTTRSHDLRAAVKGTSEREPRILLSHNPNIIKEASFAALDLVLSGHTHGGQFRLPVIGSPMAFNRHGRKYTRGWAQMKQTQIYVNRGLGTIFLPVRYQCPPEISLLRLTRADDE
jgi:predicted MPP superfamily phosphohydrolase